MESHGAGVQVLMNAKIALEMGVPIYAILAHVATATDKEGRSVPSPGQGILTTAREKSNPFFTKIMDLNFRKSEFENDYQQILKWKENMLGKEKEINAMNSFEVNYLFEQKVRKSQWNWCNDFYVNNPHISPLRGALAVYGLTVDDIDLASFHGTGTTANDLNETEVLQVKN
jgi:3-oxoacyl-(acyl-carrier-protein) synthase